MRLELIDLAQVSESTRPLVNSCYSLWNETYKPILTQAGEVLVPEMFYRAKILSVIHTDQKVHSFCLNNLWDLKLAGVPDLGYFSRVSPSLLETLKPLKIFTVEWVTVSPEDRAKLTKTPQADLVMGIGIRAMVNSDCDAAIGFSRTDLKADRIAERVGGRPQEYVDVHGIKCAVMLALRDWVRPHKFAVVQSAIDQLWDSKVNHTPYFADSSVKSFKLKAA